MSTCNCEDFNTCICCTTYDDCLQKEFVEKGRIKASSILTTFIIAILILSAIVIKIF